MRTAGLQLDHAPQLDIPLRFFLTAPLFGVAAGLLLALEGAPLLQSPWHPHTIALVHLVTLGLLTTTMLGALYQILPVVLGAEVPAARWSRVFHAVFAAGVVALVAGLRLGEPPLLGAGLVLLAGSLLPMLGLYAACLVRPSAHGATVHLLRLALAALAGTIALGLLFGSGHAAGWWPLPRTAAMPLHAFWSLGGWVGALIAGVGMAVLPMFYIAPPFPRAPAMTVLAALAGVLVTVPAVLWWAGPGPWLLLPLGCGAVALAAFTGPLLRLLRARRRKVADVSLRYWQGGLAGAWTALAMAAVAVLAPQPRWTLAFGVLYLLGFAGSVLAGMLYKIVPFLVWMHRFSRLAGRTRIPTMAELLPRVRAERQQLSHGAAVLLLAAAALYPHEVLVRTAGAAFALASAWLWLNLLHAARFPAPAAGQPAAQAGPMQPAGTD